MITEEPTKVGSRKVAGYVKAWRLEHALVHKLDAARKDRLKREGALTGGQMAQARRILGL